jgi:hypothetical protein
MEAESGRRRLVVWGEAGSGWRTGTEEDGVRQVVCTHQLGLVVPLAGDRLQIFLHASDFFDVVAAEGLTTDAADEDGGHEEERDERRKRRRTEASGKAGPLPGFRFVVQPQPKIVRVAATWAHALLLDGVLSLALWVIVCRVRASLISDLAHRGGSAVQRGVERLRAVRHGQSVRCTLPPA